MTGPDRGGVEVEEGGPATAEDPRHRSFDVAFPALFALGYQVAFRILGDRGDAEDVAQEALARALLRWGSVGDRPEGWVVRVAVNLAIDRYRRRRRSLSAQAELWAALDPNVVERLDLAKALRRLPRRQREVVVLRYLADWSEQDVADELGCAVGTVKGYGSRGLRALRNGMVGGNGEAGDGREP